MLLQNSLPLLWRIHFRYATFEDLWYTKPSFICILWHFCHFVCWMWLGDFWQVIRARLQVRKNIQYFPSIWIHPLFEFCFRNSKKTKNYKEQLLNITGTTAATSEHWGHSKVHGQLACYERNCTVSVSSGSYLLYTKETCMIPHEKKISMKTAMMKLKSVPSHVTVLWELTCRGKLQLSFLPLWSQIWGSTRFLQGHHCKCAEKCSCCLCYIHRVWECAEYVENGSEERFISTLLFIDLILSLVGLFCFFLQHLFIMNFHFVSREWSSFATIGNR